MSIRRITISVPVEVAARIKKAAAEQSVSSWVTDVIEDHLDETELDRQWAAFYESVRPRKTDIRRADALFDRLVSSRSRRTGTR
ncbi:MAG: hypothetical protein M3Y87_00510 [Myxococcota bacterium]|nr:hypothetical protein [Myxococcota bacterium]